MVYNAIRECESMIYSEAVKAYLPKNEQEKADKAFILRFMEKFPHHLSRENDFAHFTASAWAVSPDRERVLMVYHNIYDSWSWTGGHADGEEDMCAVALKELCEETGLKAPRLICPEPISLEILTVDGHMKRGSYIHSHLHLNLTYLFEADESEYLRIKADENSGVRWFSVDEMFSAVSEKWMAENIYSKLCERSCKTL